MPLLCRNCGTVNPNGTVTCLVCQMEDNLSPHGIPAVMEEKMENPENTATNCRNCGQVLNGNAQTACAACGIPIQSFNGQLRRGLIINNQLSQVAKFIFN